jgi:hypothetical protein
MFEVGREREGQALGGGRGRGGTLSRPSLSHPKIADPGGQGAKDCYVHPGNRTRVRAYTMNLP